MSEYPWNEKNNTFTWLSSLYNPFKRYLGNFETHSGTFNSYATLKIGIFSARLTVYVLSVLRKKNLKITFPL